MEPLTPYERRPDARRSLPPRSVELHKALALGDLHQPADAQ
jgi:hypothetical protein